jgi:hypothetical protein
MYSVFKKSGNYIKMAFYFKILLEFVKPGVNVCNQFLSTESKRTWSWTTKTKFGHSSQQNIFHFWLSLVRKLGQHQCSNKIPINGLYFNSGKAGKVCMAGCFPTFTYLENKKVPS